MPIEVILNDADGVIQYAPEDWSAAFARCLAHDDPALARKFTADIFAAETACLSRADGFDEALHDVLKTWDRIDQKAFVLEAMLSIHHHNEVLDLLRAVRAIGIRCYIASNQQAQRASFMSTKLGYASMFDGEFYSCHLGAAKPSDLYIELALKTVGADAAPSCSSTTGPRTWQAPSGSGCVLCLRRAQRCGRTEVSLAELRHLDVVKLRGAFALARGLLNSGASGTCAQAAGYFPPRMSSGLRPPPFTGTSPIRKRRCEFGFSIGGIGWAASSLKCNTPSSKVFHARPNQLPATAA